MHEEVEFTADIYPEFTGAAVAQAQSREDLIVHSSLACRVTSALYGVAQFAQYAAGTD